MFQRLSPALDVVAAPAGGLPTRDATGPLLNRLAMLTTKRRPLAQLVFCQGCCCGRTDRGRPELPVEMLKGVWNAEKLNSSVQLTISGCLGPCDLANVALVIAPGGNRWLGGMAGDAAYEAIVRWARDCHRGSRLLPLPDGFDDRQFERFERDSEEAIVTSSSPEAVRVTAWDLAAVASFDAGRDDIHVIERRTLPQVAAAVSAARVHEWRADVTAADADARAAAALEALHLDCPVLAADIAAVARSFLAQFGAARASLRVEVVTTNTCPKFHCDNIRVRVVTTYHGPGTEYVFRATPDDIRRGPTGALMFLKGHQHPTHSDAVLHRSPMVPPGEKRLCVVLDC